MASFNPPRSEQDGLNLHCGMNLVERRPLRSPRLKPAPLLEYRRRSAGCFAGLTIDRSSHSESKVRSADIYGVPASNLNIVCQFGGNFLTELSELTQFGFAVAACSR